MSLKMIIVELGGEGEVFITFSVDKTPNHTDVQAEEIDEGVLVVSPYKHAHVCDENVLETAYDGGGEGGVVQGAEGRGVDQDEPEHTREQNLEGDPAIIPALVL